MMSGLGIIRRGQEYKLEINEVIKKEGNGTEFKWVY